MTLVIRRMNPTNIRKKEEEETIHHKSQPEASNNIKNVGKNSGVSCFKELGNNK